MALLELPRAGASEQTIAEETLSTDGAQAPIAFSLPYPAAMIEDASYELRAEIRCDDRVAFRTTDALPVLTQGNFDEDVEVRVHTNA